MSIISPAKDSVLTAHVATDAVLRRFFGYRLKRAYNTIRSDLMHVLEPMGLRITTFSTLLLIVDHPGLRQSALAQILEMKRSNMVAIIDDLEDKGWIKREPAPEDRRAFALFATELGLRTQATAVTLVHDHDAKRLQCLTEEEQASLAMLLEKIESY